MLRFGVSTNLTGTLTLLSRDSEILWLGALASTTAAGYYKVSLAILNILLIPVQPLISTTYRELAREVGARAWDNVRYLLRSGSIIAAAYSIPAAIFLIAAGPWVVSLWGVEFLPQSYVALMILLVGVTLVAIVIGVPSGRATFFSAYGVKNPTDCPLGEKNGNLAPSVPGMGLDSKRSSSRM